MTTKISMPTAVIANSEATTRRTAQSFDIIMRPALTRVAPEGTLGQWESRATGQADGKRKTCPACYANPVNRRAFPRLFVVLARAIPAIGGCPSRRGSACAGSRCHPLAAWRPQAHRCSACCFTWKFLNAIYAGLPLQNRHKQYSGAALDENSEQNIMIKCGLSGRRGAASLAPRL